MDRTELEPLVYLKLAMRINDSILLPLISNLIPGSSFILSKIEKIFGDANCSAWDLSILYCFKEGL
jgi:hypothetical protein